MIRRLTLLLALVCLVLPAAASAEPYDADAIPGNPSGFGPPQATTAPSVSGSVSVGGVLTGNRGTWNPAATQLSSRWMRCNVGTSSCTPTGDTDLSYTVTAADVGSVIKLRVLGTNPGVLGLAGGTRTVDSAPTVTVPVPPVSGTPTPPVNVAAPSVSGTVRVGFKLTANPGQWTGAQPIGFSYGWFSCDTKGTNCVSRSTSQTYTPARQDAGRKLIVSVLGLNAFGSSTKTVTTPVVAKALAVYKRLSPFPRLVIGGRVAGSLTTLTGFKLSRVSKGSTISIACSGRGCPFRGTKVKTRKKTVVAVRRLQRGFRSGATIVVTVRRGNTLGKYTRLRFRRGSAPTRIDRCVQPRSSKPVKCP